MLELMLLAGTPSGIGRRSSACGRGGALRVGSDPANICVGERLLELMLFDETAYLDGSGRGEMEGCWYT